MPTWMPMNIGILSLNFGYHGEATAAATWANHISKYGHKSEVITFSKSGKKLKRMRKDYEFTCLSSKDVDNTLRYLDKFDVLISFGMGDIGEDELELPHYFEILESMAIPLVIYCPIAKHCSRTYKHAHDFFQLPTVVGTMFLRESIRKYFYTDPEWQGLTSILPFHVVKHPVDMTGVEIKKKTYQKFVSTSRIASSKKIDKLLASYQNYSVFWGIGSLEIWGGKDASRYGWILEEKFGDLFEKLWKGPYDHSMLDDIYLSQRFCIDLTFFADDGGIQNTFLEAAKRSTLPIVPEGWNIHGDGPAAFEIIDPRKPEHIASAVYDAVRMPEKERQERLHVIHNYMKKEHDPEKQVEGVAEYLEGMI